MPNLSIIILSYKSKEHLQVLLPSLFASKGVDFGLGTPGSYIGEVIVVDNDSRDGTAESVEHENIQLIRNVNNGFAKGNNLGIKIAKGAYILLLNPDTKVEPDTLKTMLDFMESRPDVGMSTCKIKKPDGSLDRAARRNFPNPWNSLAKFLHFEKFIKNKSFNYNISDDTADQEMEIESLVGAFCLTRRDVINKIGLLDEQFFMYGEDLDWCWRCRDAGFRVWYYPQTFITHYKGASSKKAPFKTLKAFHDAMWIFYRKHYYSRYPKIFSWLVALGIYGRLAVLTMVNVFKKNRRVSK